MPLERELLPLALRPLDEDAPAVRTELLRIAAVLQARTWRSLALVPAADHVAVPPVALRLGVALAAVTGRPAGVIDLLGRWTTGTFGAQHARLDAAGFEAAWLSPGLAVLRPPRGGRGPGLRALDALLRDEARAGMSLLVDLTGLDRTGEHLEVVAMLDAVAVVATAGRTRLRDLARWTQELPPDRSAGVLLVRAAGEARPPPRPGRP